MVGQSTNDDSMVRIGSLFSGIGGFELGLERAFNESMPGMATTIWQVEQDPYCQRILKKHWPSATIYEDITTINANELAPVDVMCGGFPCQDISVAGKGEGIQHGNRSGLFWEMWKLVGVVRPRVVIMENVSAIINNGISTVCGAMAQIGYDTEWCVISASQFGAPHQRRRWFAVAYPNKTRLQKTGTKFKTTRSFQCGKLDRQITNANKPPRQEQSNNTIRMESKSGFECGGGQNAWIQKGNYWKETIAPKPVICGMDDGVSNRVARLKALGNAIVPQCSEYIGLKIVNAGLLDDLL